MAAERLKYERCKPPSTVRDVASCLAWLNRPTGKYRVIVGERVYYEITGPAGKFFASGPAGYAFNDRGEYLGWSHDIGDFKAPGEVFAEGAKWEMMSESEFDKVFSGSVRN